MSEFGGETYDPEQDRDRLRRQLASVYALMRDAVWRTLRGIAERTHYPESSISARLRDFRKEKFGGHTVNRRRVPGTNGLHEYQLIVANDGGGTDGATAAGAGGEPAGRTQPAGE